MNRIGIRILTLLLFVAVSVSCQNFFWSHRGVTEEPIVSCVEYGYLYNWYAATDVRNIAPSGWHVPESSEFAELMLYLDNDGTFNSNTAGGLMKESGLLHWNTPNTEAINSSNFNGRGAGVRDYASGGFNRIKNELRLWNTTIAYGTRICISSLVYNEGRFKTTYGGYSQNTEMSDGCSIRLIKDNSDDTGSMTGNDGKIYPTVKIGNQVWLACNLAETLYRNGDPIPTVEDNTTWAGLTTGAKCAYENNYSYVGCDETGDELTTYPTIEYGLLYNWYAATDARDISAEGWVVPTYWDIDTLITYLGLSVAGGLLKEVGFTHWQSPNTGASNTTGFNGRGSGFRSPLGVFIDITRRLLIWGETGSGNNASGFGMDSNIESANYAYTFSDKKNGHAIRLVRTSTTLSHGETGTYVGNDGKVYKTICIGTQEWLAENLAETKYRNGDIIPEVTDDTTWSNLTTGALCAYDNDWTYVGRTKPDYY